MRDPLPASASIEPEASTTASMADGTLSWLHEKTASAIALAAGGRRAASPSLPRWPESLVGDQRAPHLALEVLGERPRQGTRAGSGVGGDHEREVEDRGAHGRGQVAEVGAAVDRLQLLLGGDHQPR